MNNNYDRVAGYYDWLSRLVFLRSQLDAQINQLQHIPNGSSFLIVGGGTGWILEEIAKTHSDLHIVYIEASAKMIAFSKRRSYGANVVEFQHIKIEDFTSSINFDVIATPFLFDNLSEETIQVVFNQLTELLKDSGIWLFNDFTLKHKKGNWWKRLFIRSMYLFFKTMKSVDTQQLVDMEPYFKMAAYKIVEEKLYYGQFIESRIYKK